MEQRVISEIRRIIREVLEEVFSEAIFKDHALERIEERLLSDYVTPSFPYNHIKDKVKFLEKITFDGQYNLGIKLYHSKTIYTALDVAKWHKTGKKEYSIGNNLWTIVRGNEIETVMFGKDTYKTPNVDWLIDINTLINKALKKGPDKNGQYVLTLEDIKKQTVDSTEKKPILDLPIIELSNGSWFVNEKDQELIYAKNINKKISFDNAFENFKESDINALIDKDQWKTAHLA